MRVIAMSVMTENTLAGSGGLRRCCSSAPDGLDYESVIRSGHYLVLVEPTIWFRALARRVSTCRAARLYPRALTGSHNHTLAVAALMPLRPCRSSPLITGARLAFALLYRHTLFLDYPDQRYVAVRTCVWLPQGDSGPHHDCGL